MEDAQAILHELAADCWRLLEAAPDNRVSLARTPVLATAGLDGAPESRTVVLRACDVARRTLTFFTDARSAKVAQLEADNRVSVTVYDRDHAVQLRLWGRAGVHMGDAIARRHWDAAPAASRRAYVVSPSPGEVVAQPMSGIPDGEYDLESGYGNFAVVVIAVRWLEWLRLEPAGNLAARFEWDEDALASATWIIP